MSGDRGYVVPLTRAMSATLERIEAGDPDARVVGHQDGLPIILLPGLRDFGGRRMVLTTTGRLEQPRPV